MGIQYNVILMIAIILQEDDRERITDYTAYREELLEL